jgi:hypothetical protein
VRLADRFPAAETSLRDRVEDLIVPSEPAVQTAVEEDAEARCWVTVTCPSVHLRLSAAFSAEDLADATGAWPFWCDRVVEELDRRMRERGKSGW